MKEHQEQWEILRDVRVPEQVHQRLETTLSTLPDPMRKKHYWARWVASVAAVLALGFGVLAANPAIAANIPIIGRLFGQVEKNVSFPGDYDTRAQALPQNENSVQTDSGLTVTAAEIYCDGYSIFIILEINAEEPIFDDIIEIITYYNRNKKGEFVNEPGAVAQCLYLEYDWKTDQMTNRKAVGSNTIQGKVMDDHTFIGMLKLDIGPESEVMTDENQTVSLQIKSIGYDKRDTSTQMNEFQSRRIPGAWNLALDFAVDSSAARVVTVNKQNQDGYGIEKVLVSPYQIVVYTIAPYTVLTEKDMATREEIIEKYGERPYDEADVISACELDRKDRLGKKVYEYVEVAVFNDQGVAFEGEAGEENILVFSIQNASVDQLHIFLTTERFSIVSAPNIEAARNNAEFEVEIEVR